VIGTRVNVVSSPTLVVQASGGSFSRPSPVNICNRGTDAVYLGGGTAITTSDGFQVDPGVWVSFDLAVGETVYGIVASGTAIVHVAMGGM